MKTIQLHPSGIVRFVSCAAAVLGLGIASAVASPIITVPLAGQTFGVGDEIHLVSKGVLNESTAFKYSVTGTCVGTGSLAGVIKSGTPIAALFTGVKLSGTYTNPNPDGGFPIVVFNKKYSKTTTVQGFGKVTLSAVVKGGTDINRKVYFDVTKVKITAGKPIPPGGIRFEKGAKLVINAAPVIEFHSISTNVDETSATGNVTIRVNKIGTGKVSVKYVTADVTANSGDYTQVLDGLLTFPAKTGPQSITIPITPNTDKDGFRKFTVTLSNPTGGAVLGTKLVHTVGIRDDD
jgi:hypothetical protein